MGIKTCGLGSRVKILTVMQLNHNGFHEMLLNPTLALMGSRGSMSKKVSF